jgi:ADP-heptose:LPS heptosyltransferase
VLFVAASDGPAKRWREQRWADLASRVRALGFGVRVVTLDETAGWGGIDPLPAPTPGDAVDVVTAARAVVGVDTGLTHLAAQQRTPTVTICRRASAVFFRAWPHTRLVLGDRCDDVCAAVESDYAYNARVDLRGFEWQPRVCPVGGRCLDAVSPDDVMRALTELL